MGTPATAWADGLRPSDALNLFIVSLGGNRLRQPGAVLASRAPTACQNPKSEDRAAGRPLGAPRRTHSGQVAGSSADPRRGAALRHGLAAGLAPAHRGVGGAGVCRDGGGASARGPTTAGLTTTAAHAATGQQRTAQRNVAAMRRRRGGRRRCRQQPLGPALGAHPPLSRAAQRQGARRAAPTSRQGRRGGRRHIGATGFATCG
mmetsp:Transcript_44218/g.127778  ORF Transcript_44218/g.127778 Transcript_44218/m.127778 type:complete len:204 (-) Transcript_44218:1049-1660(-)